MSGVFEILIRDRTTTTHNQPTHRSRLHLYLTVSYVVDRHDSSPTADEPCDFVLSVHEHQWEGDLRTAKRGFLARHGIVRNSIRADVLFFALPAIVVFFVGLVVSARDGYDGLVTTLWNLVRQPRNLYLLSVPNIVGLVFLVVGLIIAVVAMATIRRFHASTLVIREDHQLITHGIYRFSRHPIYLGAIMVCIGVPVHVLSLYGPSLCQN